MSFMAKRNESKIDLFVGGSLSSIILATYHKTANPNKEVMILEGSSRVGGDNGSYLAKNGEFFDYGMRVYYECNIKALDNIVARSLPAEKLVFLEDNKKDLAACYFRGTLQSNSPCLDLRALPANEKNLIMKQIMNTRRDISKDYYQNCSDYLIDRLGKTVAQRYLFPILENFYDRQVEELTVDASTAHFGYNERVILFDEQETLKFMQDEHLRMRLAFPNQTNLPEPYCKRNSRGIYPAQLGMQHIIDGIKENFLSLGGKFIFNAKVESLVQNSSSISTLNYTDKVSGKRNSLDLRALFWGAPLHILANLLGYASKFEFERGKRAHLAHIILDQKLKLNDLYYLFNFDPSYKIFRVANYSAYCPNSSNDGLYRATAEYWSESEKPDIQNIFDELLQMTVVDDRHKIMFHEVATGPAFPLQSVKNEKYLDDIREYVQSLKLKNVLPFGQSARKHTFYTPDILSGAFFDYEQFYFQH